MLFNYVNGKCQVMVNSKRGFTLIELLVVMVANPICGAKL
ncbi:MAG: hypothetical protein DRP66_04505 [Planctomycetota bacterium]|nr:MAG: hypothetical protein DRP66_04505 [Planctomycetota bacterium]